MHNLSHTIHRFNVMAQTSKEGGQLRITQPLGSCGCLWKLRMINGIYHHSHPPLHLVCHRIHYGKCNTRRDREREREGGEREREKERANDKVLEMYHISATAPAGMSSNLFCQIQHWAICHIQQNCNIQNYSHLEVMKLVLTGHH